jgi:hypothetical protein
MKVWELIAELSKHPAGADVKLTKWNDRKEEHEAFTYGPVEIWDDEVQIEIGDKE